MAISDGACLPAIQILLLTCPQKDKGASLPCLTTFGISTTRLQHKKYPHKRHKSPSLFYYSAQKLLPRDPREGQAFEEEKCRTGGHCQAPGGESTETPRGQPESGECGNSECGSSLSSGLTASDLTQGSYRPYGLTLLMAGLRKRLMDCSLSNAGQCAGHSEGLLCRTLQEGAGSSAGDGLA